MKNLGTSGQTREAEAKVFLMKPARTVLIPKHSSSQSTQVHFHLLKETEDKIFVGRFCNRTRSSLPHTITELSYVSTLRKRQIYFKHHQHQS